MSMNLFRRLLRRDSKVKTAREQAYEQIRRIERRTGVPMPLKMRNATVRAYEREEEERDR